MERILTTSDLARGYSRKSIYQGPKGLVRVSIHYDGYLAQSYVRTQTWSHANGWVTFDELDRTADTFAGLIKTPSRDSAATAEVLSRAEELESTMIERYRKAML